MNKEYWVYVDKNGDPYKSPKLGKITLMKKKPNAIRKYLTKRYGGAVGYKKVKLVEV